MNRCAVDQHTFLSPIGTGADKLDVAVGACKFSVGGNDTVLINTAIPAINPASGGAVRYSRPIGVTADAPMGGGNLVLELEISEWRSGAVDYRAHHRGGDHQFVPEPVRPRPW